MPAPARSYITYALAPAKAHTRAPVIIELNCMQQAIAAALSGCAESIKQVHRSKAAAPELPSSAALVTALDLARECAEKSLQLKQHMPCRFAPHICSSPAGGAQ